MKALADEQLVELTREKGDTAAYGELVTRYQGRVYGLAYSWVGDWAEAEDMTQEAFLCAYMNLDQLRDPAKFASWLKRISFGTCMDWLRAFRPEDVSLNGGRCG